jgi:cysteine-rich repeat protein
VQLVQLKVDEVERDFFDNDGATGPGYETFLEIARPFEEPVTGSIFRLSFTRTSNGPRIVEIDALTTSFCSNGILEPDEECDDGNIEERDGCDGACGIEPACPDERVGACVEPIRASLRIDERRPGGEKVVARMHGFDDATTQLDFGDPVGGNSRHSLCVYSGSALVLGLLAEPGETCGAKQKPCWRAKGRKGWSYRDPRGETTGVRKIDAWSGKLGKGGLQVRARNDRAKGQEHLPVGAAAALVGSSTVHLQLRTREGRCYETQLETIEASEAELFEATTP